MSFAKIKVNDTEIVSVDNEPLVNSQNLIKSGSVSEHGSAFDISSYHSGAIYVDLAAALGANGANVPENVRRGGMIVKFINSTSNKYEQYRLLSTSWSINETDWKNTDSDILIKDVIDLSMYAVFTINPNASNKWANTYRGMLVSVKPSVTYQIKAQAGKNAIFVPLKTLQTCQVLTSFENNIATGYSRMVTIQNGGTMIFIAPDDCNVLYIQATDSTGDITPSFIELNEMTHFDDKPLWSSKQAVTSQGIIKSISGIIPPAYQIYTNISVQGNLLWYAGNNDSCLIYKVSDKDCLHVVGNETANSIMVFLSSIEGLESISTNYTPIDNATSNVFMIYAGQTVDYPVPAGSNYACITKTHSTYNEEPVYVGIYKNFNDQVESKYYNIEGHGQQTQFIKATCDTGYIFKICLDKTQWSSSTVPNGYILFSISDSNRNQYVYRFVKGGEPLEQNIFYISAEAIIIAIRADVGQTIGVEITEAKTTDVTSKLTNLIYDVSFENENNIYKSYTVKLPQGSLVKYNAGSDGVNPVVKVFSRNTEDSTYLTKSVVPETVGVVEGELLMDNEGFVTVFSTTANPMFKAYSDKPVSYDLNLPHEIYFDTDNMVTILAVDDGNATEYDNYAVNTPTIIPVNESLYCMLYHGIGEGKLPVVLMAYSTDLIHWTRDILPGIEAPYPGTNVIFKEGVIVGEFSTEMINEFCVCLVNDSDYKYRMFASIRQVTGSTTTTIVGECHYLFKSNDLVHWTPMKKVLRHPHDTFSSALSYGDKIHIYTRMWDYSQSDWSKKRMIGDLWIDMWGNVIVPPSGLFGNGLYNSAAGRIGPDRDVFFPTNYYYTDVAQNIGDGYFESYIRDGDAIFYAPSYNLPKLKKVIDNDGWGTVGTIPIVSNGRDYYVAYFQCKIKHGQPAVSGNQGELRLCPIRWVTKAMYNNNGGE